MKKLFAIGALFFAMSAQAQSVELVNEALSFGESPVFYDVGFGVNQKEGTAFVEVQRNDIGGEGGSAQLEGRWFIDGLRLDNTSGKIFYNDVLVAHVQKLIIGYTVKLEKNISLSLSVEKKVSSDGSSNRTNHVEVVKLDY